MFSQEVNAPVASPRCDSPASALLGLDDNTTLQFATTVPVLTHLSTPYWVLDVDHLTIIWANTAAVRLWQAKSLGDLQTRDLSVSTTVAVRRRLEQFQEDFERGKAFTENWTIHPNGQPVTRLMHCRGIRLYDGRMAMLVEANDAKDNGDSDTIRSAQALLHTPVMVSMYSMDGARLYANPAARSMLGAECEHLNQHFCDKSFVAKLYRRLQTDKEFSTECRVNTAAGKAWHRLSVQLSCDNLSGKEAILISEVDITQRRNAEHRVQSLAYRDPLTALPNRTFLNEKIDHYLNVSRKHNTQLALLFIDLDRFKIINDSLGHAVGDALLKRAAKLLQSAVRRSDTLVRLGGDEFVVVMHHLPEPRSAEALARRLLDTMKDPVTLLGHELRLSGSIGISVFPDDGDNSATLMKNADLAMYHAKEQGGSCVARFHPTMGQDLKNRLQLEVDLRRAINRNEFELHFQPRVCSRTEQIVGVEALIRWQHPERGMVSPAEFIPLAEDTGMIVDIGDWVLREATAICADWHQRDIDLQVSLNVASRQLDNRFFVDRVLQNLKHTGCPANKLELELTESMLVSETSNVLETLYALQDTGIKITIDDFGTGYSNLGYLKDFPIDKLKIDRSFILDSEQHALVEMIVTLGEMLNVSIVAEGVETKEQVQWLKKLNCSEFQGYYFSRPLPRVDFEQLYRQKQRKMRTERLLVEPETADAGFH